jgi:hypothetical protein
MPPIPPSRFLYRSSAVALAGQFTRPVPEVLKVQAASVLPPTGGEGDAAITGPFTARSNQITFSSAFTRVSGAATGAAPNRTFHTFTAVRLTGLNFMNKVEAQEVYASLTTETDEATGVFRVAPVATFTGLHINKVPVSPVAVPWLAAPHTLDDLKKGGIVNDKRVDNLEAEQKKLAKQPPTSPTLMLVADFVESKELFQPLPAISGCTVGGACVTIELFGTVHLGELLITQGSRRLTMIRVELNGTDEGVVSIGCLEGNGVKYP